MAEQENNGGYGARVEPFSWPELGTPDLLTTMQATVSRYAMLEAEQTVVVGASGGPDSTALLHALAHLRDELRLSLVACHVNHGFRGDEAEEDADYVRALCEQWNVPCRMKAVDVPAFQKRRHLSAQQAARIARHRILRQVAAEAGSERIALAHTRDDRTETILLNVLRGTGLEGLGGFAPVAFPLVRPLYDVTRAQVEQYCQYHNLNPRYDSSNTKLTYRRNRIRTELLPQLRAYYNPKADEAFLRLADLAQEDNALLETLAAQNLQELIPKKPSDCASTLCLSVIGLNTLPIALRRRVLRQAIEQVRGSLQDISFEAIEGILQTTGANRTWSVELPMNAEGTVVVRCDENTITLARVAPVSLALPWQQPVNVPGRTLVLGRNVLVDVQACSPEELPAALKDKWETPAYDALRSLGKMHGQIAVYSVSNVTLPIVARSWRPGDKMRPRGLNGTKKIQDLFTDEKIPAAERTQIPLLTEGRGRILMAGALRAEETSLCACRLPCSKEELGTACQTTQRKIAAFQEMRELFVMLLMYQ